MRIRLIGGIVTSMEHGTLKPCGTMAAYRRHRYNNEPACDECRQAANAYQRARMRAKGQKPRTEPPCGTNAGYWRHHYTGTPYCAACRKAHSEYQMEWDRKRKRKQRRGTWNDVILDYLETWGGMAPVNLASRIAERHPDVKHRTVLKALLRMEERGLVEADRYGPNDVVYRVSDWYLENVG